ncbi:hypothetical protein BsWGS_23109 [Bradybaena similaris]
MLILKSSLLLLVVCSLAGQGSAGVSNKILDFLTYFTGERDNSAQVNRTGDDHDFIQVVVIPVDVPVLGADPVVLIQESVNGVIALFQLGVIRETSDNFINLTLYSLTDYSNFRPGMYPIKNISQAQQQDLQTVEGCVASFELPGKGLMAGIYPDCDHGVNGVFPWFTVTYTCDFKTAIFPSNSEQKSTLRPYILSRTSPRYPLAIAPKDYVSPCDN